ncbi:hypothetical protein STVIR_3811 [Streptomyces viridochromogenes Tue57]|uniref:Uncharacterized protein n=1 Tax=Streptomyces viridochromogenes Tue57 TaxID=1160705 RepID=L8PFQ4_STRVR|nr:hypothetical protein STVIR_3811 [Streptomyces viridochromogenes Tue57]
MRPDVITSSDLARRCARRTRNSGECRRRGRIRGRIRVPVGGGERPGPASLPTACPRAPTAAHGFPWPAVR